MRRLLFSLCLVTVFFACLVTVFFASPAAQPGPAPQTAIALMNASVLNVRNGSIQRNVTLVLRDGRIESIGAGAAPAGARVFDLHGRVVLPGLIDAHVHIASLPQLRAALESGVTTIRSAGV